MRTLGIVAAMSLIFGAYRAYNEVWGFKHAPAGVFVASEPKQGPEDTSQVWNLKGFRVESLASYDITCRLILKDYYFTQSVAKLSPMDFTVTWGRASDEPNVQAVNWQHSDRYAMCGLKQDFRLTTDYFFCHMANMHLIPADGEVEKALRGIRLGEFIRMKGYLVRVVYSDGTAWKSSLMRTDTEDGACEVMLVKSVDVLGPADLQVR